MIAFPISREKGTLPEQESCLSKGEMSVFVFGQSKASKSYPFSLISAFRRDVD
jgi:hypothetical protein